MVSIKCQSQYTALLLAFSSSRRRGSGAGKPETRPPLAAGPASPSGSGSPPPAARQELGGALLGPALPGPEAEADTGITLLQAPGGGDGGGRRGGKLREHKSPFPLPSLSAVRVTSLYGQRKKKIIKKTYKITIEKVILLGEAPLRLREAFVLFLMQFPFRHTSTAFWLRV